MSQDGHPGQLTILPDGLGEAEPASLRQVEVEHGELRSLLDCELDGLLTVSGSDDLAARPAKS